MLPHYVVCEKLCECTHSCQVSGCLVTTAWCGVLTASNWLPAGYSAWGASACSSMQNKAGVNQICPPKNGFLCNMFFSSKLCNNLISSNDYTVIRITQIIAVLCIRRFL